MQARYALRIKSAEHGVIWSTGGVWSATVPEVAKLMTGPKVDEFAKRHPTAQVVDVIVYREAVAIWNAAFRANTVENSTHEQREAARRAGDRAVAAAGYTLS